MTRSVFKKAHWTFSAGAHCGGIWCSLACWNMLVSSLSLASPSPNFLLNIVWWDYHLFSPSLGDSTWPTLNHSDTPSPLWKLTLELSGRDWKWLLYPEARSLWPPPTRAAGCCPFSPLFSVILGLPHILSIAPFFLLNHTSVSFCF